jgi:thiamine pyrophosphate-dependent acetolactate synthase large subunit-like protein
MEEQNVDVYMQTFVASKNGFLSLNQRVKDLVKIATEYGVVEYKVENEEELIEDKSTAVS